MTGREFLDICGKNNTDNRGILIYFSFCGRIKYPNIISLREEFVKIDSECEWIKISFKAPYNDTEDKSDTMSVKEFSDLLIKNNALDYEMESTAVFDKYGFNSSNIICESNVCIDDGWVYLLY